MRIQDTIPSVITINDNNIYSGELYSIDYDIRNFFRDYMDAEGAEYLVMPEETGSAVPVLDPKKITGEDMDILELRTNSTQYNATALYVAQKMSEGVIDRLSTRYNDIASQKTANNWKHMWYVLETDMSRYKTDEENVILRGHLRKEVLSKNIVVKNGLRMTDAFAVHKTESSHSAVIIYTPVYNVPGMYLRQTYGIDKKDRTSDDESRFVLVDGKRLANKMGVKYDIEEKVVIKHQINLDRETPLDPLFLKFVEKRLDPSQFKKSPQKVRAERYDTVKSKVLPDVETFKKSAVKHIKNNKGKEAGNEKKEIKGKKSERTRETQVKPSPKPKKKNIKERKA